MHFEGVASLWKVGFGLIASFFLPHLLRRRVLCAEVDTGKDKGSQPLLSLILDSNSDGKMKKDQQLFVVRVHTYLHIQAHWHCVESSQEHVCACDDSK